MTSNDEDDEWDRKIRDSLRYSVRLLIKHPNIDPIRITETLRLKPNLSGAAGSPCMTLAGKALPGVNRESNWSHWFRVERNRLFFSDAVKLIDELEPHRGFLHEIVNGGGDITLIISLPGDINIGDTFRWQDMARLSAMRIELGIEVFPEFD